MATPRSAESKAVDTSLQFIPLNTDGKPPFGWEGYPDTEETFEALHRRKYHAFATWAWRSQVISDIDEEMRLHIDSQPLVVRLSKSLLALCRTPGDSLETERCEKVRAGRNIPGGELTETSSYLDLHISFRSSKETWRALREPHNGRS